MSTTVSAQYPRELKARALKRELAIRERVYPLRVAKKKMSQEEANFELDVMHAILRDYEESPAP
jgi:hypothetical protein